MAFLLGLDVLGKEDVKRRPWTYLAGELGEQGRIAYDLH